MIDGKIVAAMKRTSMDGDFRANVSLGGVSETIELTKQEEDIVLRATKAIGINIAGVDLVRSNIPAEYKIAQGGKHVLKEVGRRIIPHEVIDRPKGYFPVPGLRNMQGEYLELAKEIFSQPAAKNRQLFKRSYIDDLLDNPEDHVTKFGSRLWHATLLEFWLQEQGVS